MTGIDEKVPDRDDREALLGLRLEWSAALQELLQPVEGYDEARRRQLRDRVRRNLKKAFGKSLPKRKEIEDFLGRWAQRDLPVSDLAFIVLQVQQHFRVIAAEMSAESPGEELTVSGPYEDALYRARIPLSVTEGYRTVRFAGSILDDPFSLGPFNFFPAPEQPNMLFVEVQYPLRRVRHHLTFTEGTSDVSAETEFPGWYMPGQLIADLEWRLDALCFMANVGIIANYGLAQVNVQSSFIKEDLPPPQHSLRDIDHPSLLALLSIGPRHLTAAGNTLSNVLRQWRQGRIATNPEGRLVTLWGLLERELGDLETEQPYFSKAEIKEIKSALKAAGFVKDKVNRLINEARRLKKVTRNERIAREICTLLGQEESGIPRLQEKVRHYHRLRSKPAHGTYMRKQRDLTEARTAISEISDTLYRLIEHNLAPYTAQSDS